jgi:hypothetical protein
MQEVDGRSREWLLIGSLSILLMSMFHLSERQSLRSSCVDAVL